MPSNIEIKARVRDFEELRRRAATLSDTPCEVIPQEDTFFVTTRGRLKLRELQGRPAQLIFYERADQGGLDVQNGRIELLLIDAEPAIALADQLGLKVLLITDSTAAAGKAIAMKQGETALKAELDMIIEGFQGDGTLTKIEADNQLPDLGQ